MAADAVVGLSRSRTASRMFDELDIGSMFSGEVATTALVSACSLLAVWIPFYRGLKIFFEARVATRSLGPSALRRALREGGTKGGRHHVKPISVLMLRVLRKSVREDQSYPMEFVIDATRQYVVNEYDANYARRISMYSNILPPIGFIGTMGGLLVLFLSMHLADGSLELSAVALALTSSIFALIGFAVLEGLKIGLYGRLLSCLQEALTVADEAPAS